MAECGPRPVQADFTKKNGNVRWSAYNKALRQWTKCTRTAIRQTPENVAARAGATSDIFGEGFGTIGDIARALGGGSRDPEAESELRQKGPPWLLPVAVIGGIFLLTRR